MDKFCDFFLKSTSYQCKKHGALVASVPWVLHDSGFIYKFEHLVATNSSKSAVSREIHISWKAVGDIISKIKKSLDAAPASDFDNLVSIDIDETSYRKGHKYLAVLLIMI